VTTASSRAPPASTATTEGRQRRHRLPVRVDPPSTAATTADAQIDFSYGTDVIWKWNPAGNDWLHSYTDTGADIDTTPASRCRRRTSS